jgi:hypothetical protein
MNGFEMNMMRSYLLVPILVVGCFLPVTAQGIEFGSIRGLQSGAVGDSPQFIEIEKYEADAAVTMKRRYGEYKLNNDTTSKTNMTDLDSHVLAGGGMALSKQLALTAYLDANLIRDFDLVRDRVEVDQRQDAGLYEHEFMTFMVFTGNPIVVGGGIGFKIFGQETRELKLGADEEAGPDFVTNTSSAFMPVMSLFGGVKLKQFVGTLGVKFFSKGTAEVKAVDNDGETHDYDIVRRNPAEIHVDGKFMASKMVSIAGSINYVLTRQSSESINEFSTVFVGDKGQERFTGNDVRNDNHIEIGAGVRIDASKMVGILAGLEYIGSSYKEESYASLEHDNLGGILFNLGTEVNIQKFRGVFHFGYMLDESVSYTQKGSDKSSARIDEHQSPSIEEGDKVDMSSGQFEVLIGAGIAL